MSPGGGDYSWLPDHHLPVAATLAHTDELIERASNALLAYLRPPGPLEFDNVAAGQRANVTVTAIAPLPSAAARYAADALTQLRAAIEHTVYAEVEHQLQRPLTKAEAQAIEMPARTSETSFSGWVNDRRRGGIAPLQEGSALVQRMRDLQPYRSDDPDNHPLRILAEHTNLAKHRTPTVAATLLGVVMPDVHHPDLEVTAANSSTDDRPLRPGDVLASSPLYQRIPLSIVPKVCIQRPHTGTWHVFIHELGDLEEWVRKIAVPTLILGRHDVDPLPPQVTTNVGHHDERAALIRAGTVPARVRAMRQIGAEASRMALADLLGP